MQVLRSVYQNRTTIGAVCTGVGLVHHKLSVSRQVATGQMSFAQGIRANTYAAASALPGTSDMISSYEKGAMVARVSKAQSPYQQLKEEYPYFEKSCRILDASQDEWVREKVDTTVQAVSEKVSGAVDSMGKVAQLTFHQAVKDAHANPTMLEPW